MPTIRQIRNFLLLSSELHFARAAEKLAISQAALSSEIRKLENEIGCQLFDRSDRWQIRLTEAGQAYLQQVSALPDLLANAQESARRAARGETGTLSIAVANAVYDSLDVGAVFQNMLRKYPEVKLKILDYRSSPQVADAIRSGSCDAGLLAYIHGSTSIDGLRSVRVMDSEVAFAFPENHPLAHKPDLTVEELKNCNFIFPPADEAPLLRKHFEEFFLSHCHTLPHIVHEAVGLRAIRQLVRAGLGVALIPYDQSERKIIFRRDVAHGMRRSIIVAWENGNHSVTLHNFTATVCENRSAVI